MASTSGASNDGSDKWATDVSRVTVPIEIVVDVARPSPPIVSVLTTHAAVHPITDDALDEPEDEQPPGRSSSSSSSSRLTDSSDIDEEDPRDQHQVYPESQESREAAIRTWAIKWLLAFYVLLFAALAFGVLTVAILTTPNGPPLQSTPFRAGQASAGVSEMEVTLPVVFSLSWNSTELLSKASSGAWHGTWNICPATRIGGAAYDNCLFEGMRQFDVASGNIWVLSELPRGSRWEVVLTGDAAKDVSGAVLDQRLLAAPQLKDLDDSLIGESRRFAHWSPEFLSTGDDVLVSWGKTAGVCRQV